MIQHAPPSAECLNNLDDFSGKHCKHPSVSIWIYHLTTTSTTTRLLRYHNTESRFTFASDATNTDFLHILTQSSCVQKTETQREMLWWRVCWRRTHSCYNQPAERKIIWNYSDSWWIIFNPKNKLSPDSFLVLNWYHNIFRLHLNVRNLLWRSSWMFRRATKSKFLIFTTKYLQYWYCDDIVGMTVDDQ